MAVVATQWLPRYKKSDIALGAQNTLVAEISLGGIYDRLMLMQVITIRIRQKKIFSADGFNGCDAIVTNTGKKALTNSI